MSNPNESQGRRLLRQRSSSHTTNRRGSASRTPTNTVIYETTLTLNVPKRPAGSSHSRPNLRRETSAGPTQRNRLSATATASNLISHSFPWKPMPPPIVPRRSTPPRIAPRTTTPRPMVSEEPPIPKERLSRPQQYLALIPTASDHVKEPVIMTSSVKRSPRSFHASQPVGNIPGLCGLTNNGNTCFVNSALQCLSNIPDFTRWAKDQRVPRSMDSTNLIHAYCSLMQAMWSGNNSCLNPRGIKEIVSRSASMFSDHAQRDAHEFMNSFLNILQRTDAKSIVTDLFHIHTQSQVTCSQCQFIDRTDQVTTFLPLPITSRTSNGQEISLEQLIQDFSHEANLDGLYYCQHCNGYRQAKQKTSIDSPFPRALIVQLQRFPFDGTDRKVETFVRYQLEYDHLLSNNDRYRLCAVSVHVGTLASGHYTTLARNQNTEQWYRFNDGSVHEITADAVVTKDAYILVYLGSEELRKSIS